MQAFQKKINRMFLTTKNISHLTAEMLRSSNSTQRIIGSIGNNRKSKVLKDP